ncbi:MAG: hypothetical protein EXS10_00850 [Phycisphaerales bacterium]|nr:hypothetical protein [Phycisphaerales bacterium]
MSVWRTDKTRTWRQRFIDLAAVTAVTALVWLWASNQTLQSRSVSFDVIVESNDPSRLTVTNSGPHRVVAQLVGSRQSVLNAFEVLNGRAIRFVTGADGVPASAGDHNLPVLDILSASPVLAPLGVDLSNLSPSSIRIGVREAE